MRLASNQLTDVCPTLPLTSIRPHCPYDEDLEHRVRNYLFGYKMPSLRHVQVQAENGCVILSGIVSSFYQKQLCLTCCRRVAGVITVIDQVRVQSPWRT